MGLATYKHRSETGPNASNDIRSKFGSKSPRRKKLVAAALKRSAHTVGAGVPTVKRGVPKYKVVAGRSGGHGISVATVSATKPVSKRRSAARAAAAESELSEQLVHKVSKSGTDVSTLCDAYGLKRADLGRLTGFSLRALAEWSAGKLPSEPAQRRLNEIRRLLDALSDIVRAEAIPRWLHQVNPAFDNITPLQMIELGQIDQLWAMIHDLQSGEPQ
jgi:DNA-binding transcriptional regulator YiaG